MFRPLLIGLLLLSLVAPALAAKGSPQMTLTHEYVSNSPNPSAPLDCLNEDDIDQRTFVGSLNGSYSTSYVLCDTWNQGIYWSAGGEGVLADIVSTDPVADAEIVSPSGMANHAVLLSATTRRGVTSYHYSACAMPPFSLSTDTGTDPLAGGTWTITLTGTLGKATFYTAVQMGYVSFQQAYCPTSEQNITP